MIACSIGRFTTYRIADKYGSARIRVWAGFGVWAKGKVAVRLREVRDKK